jgi:hypothetical protein
MKQGFILFECIMYIALILLTVMLAGTFFSSLMLVMQKTSPDKLLSRFENTALINQLNALIESASTKKESWFEISPQALLWHAYSDDHKIAVHKNYVLFSAGRYSAANKKLHNVQRSFLSYKNGHLRFAECVGKNQVKGISIISPDMPSYFIPCLSEQQCLYLR